jgi:hypothetical protein
VTDKNLINRIRTIFLHQRPLVTISDAARLLGWPADEMARAIADGEVEAYDTFTGGWIWREELIAKAMEIWLPDLIEDALGADASAVLPDAIRLTELRVRLPRYHVDMLEHFAERDRTTVSGTLARELDAVASAHAEELSAVIPAFAETLAWPTSRQLETC